MKTAKLTKKEFEQMLNAQYAPQPGDGWNNKSGARTRPYGTWLRNADRWMFNRYYDEYLKTGKA